MPAPATSIAAALSHGSTLRVGRGETPSWTSMKGLQNVEWPDRMPADLDVTHQASPGATEENKPGLLPAVDWTQEMLLDAGSDGDTALTELNVRDSTTGEKELHLVEITVGTGVNKKQVTCMGYLKDYKPVGALKGVIMMRATWRLMATVANAA
ncbi:phage tail protein [Pararhodobacter zhoushanensis]|uniref:Uncharacterized protein n=1 Tax=Pararhodobacter zhoushanensis TaxID=2479545 RepID=A0ABT3H417_9RHOB|nr:hypothetical protein [Pararhodobacter zhoushanensis]MCW1934538.1 hypothetical protein [Pararhodobacter zhoushanensis]